MTDSNSRLPRKILHRFEKISTRGNNSERGKKKSGQEKMILDCIEEFWTRQKNSRPLLSLLLSKLCNGWILIQMLSQSGHGHANTIQLYLTVGTAVFD